MAQQGLRSLGRSGDKPGVVDTDKITPGEVLQYVIDRLIGDAEMDEALAAQQGVRSLPGQKARNIAVTHLQTGQLWLKEAQAGMDSRR